jgi:succinate dehydrogenase/fumarate reductase flavoprotein subunit
MPITTDIRIRAVNVLVVGAGAAGPRAAIAGEVLVAAQRTELSTRDRVAPTAL